MEHNFDEVINRQNTSSLKWDKYKTQDVIPMWVADMDFKSPPSIIEALYKRVHHGIFGYTTPPSKLSEVIVKRLETKYDWEIETSWIVWLPNVETVLNLSCRSVGNDLDEVLTFSPIYPAFLSAPKLSRRNLRIFPLCRKNGKFTFDTERLKKEISTKSKLLLLCNPHNPVGRAYDRKELKEIAEICVDHDVTIFSDEIYCDLILDNKKHTPIAALSKEIASKTITAMSPSKTYNIAGLNCAFAIVPDNDLRRKFLQNYEGIVTYCNAFAYTACITAYENCEGWRIKLVDYLQTNREIVKNYINKEIPCLSMDHVEATYLAWINTKSLDVSNPVVFFEKAGVGLSDGRYFCGNGYVRLNFACPRKVLLKALNRMRRAIK